MSTIRKKQNFTTQTNIVVYFYRKKNSAEKQFLALYLNNTNKVTNYVSLFFYRVSFILKPGVGYKFKLYIKTVGIHSKYSGYSLFNWTEWDAEIKRVTQIFHFPVPFIPGVALCLGNVAKNMSKWVWNNSSEFWHCSHPLHGEGFSRASLAICKNCAWNN